MTLSGTLLCPGTQIDNTFKLKKFQPKNERTSQASLITSLPIGDGTEETPDVQPEDIIPPLHIVGEGINRQTCGNTLVTG